MTNSSPTEAPKLLYRDGVRPADAPLVEQLVRCTGFFSPEEVLVARELVEAFLGQGAASGYRFLFAEQDGRALGYACYGPIPMTDRRYDLYWIAVAPETQGRGVGRLLLAETERRIAAEGGTRVYAETSSRAKYEPTRQFYRGTGYTLAATLTGFYADGEDKVIFVRHL